MAYSGYRRHHHHLLLVAIIIFLPMLLGAPTQKPQERSPWKHVNYFPRESPPRAVSTRDTESMVQSAPVLAAEATSKNGRSSAVFKRFSKFWKKLAGFENFSSTDRVQNTVRNFDEGEAKMHESEVVFEPSAPVDRPRTGIKLHQLPSLKLSPPPRPAGGVLQPVKSNSNPPPAAIVVSTRPQVVEKFSQTVWEGPRDSLQNTIESTQYQQPQQMKGTQSQKEHLIFNNTPQTSSLNQQNLLPNFELLKPHSSFITRGDSTTSNIVELVHRYLSEDTVSPLLQRVTQTGNNNTSERLPHSPGHQQLLPLHKSLPKYTTEVTSTARPEFPKLLRNPLEAFAKREQTNATNLEHLPPIGPGHQLPLPQSEVQVDGGQDLPQQVLQHYQGLAEENTSQPGIPRPGNGQNNSGSGSQDRPQQVVSQQHQGLARNHSSEAVYNRSGQAQRYNNDPFTQQYELPQQRIPGATSLTLDLLKDYQIEPQKGRNYYRLSSHSANPLGQETYFVVTPSEFTLRIADAFEFSPKFQETVYIAGESLIDIRRAGRRVDHDLTKCNPCNRNYNPAVSRFNDWQYREAKCSGTVLCPNNRLVNAGPNTCVQGQNDTTACNPCGRKYKIVTTGKEGSRNNSVIMSYEEIRRKEQTFYDDFTNVYEFSDDSWVSKNWDTSCGLQVPEGTDAKDMYRYYSPRQG